VSSTSSGNMLLGGRDRDLLKGGGGLREVVTLKSGYGTVSRENVIISSI
jgi:hypothetical protein